jgi:hypothetical protein
MHVLIKHFCIIFHFSFRKKIESRVVFNDLLAKDLFILQ